MKIILSGTINLSELGYNDSIKKDGIAMERDVLEYDLNHSVGERLRALRENVGLTQDKLSERVGFSNHYYGQVERGYKKLSRQLAIKLAEFYGVTLDYLYLGKESVRENDEYSNKAELTRYIGSCTEEDCTVLLPIVRAVREAFWDYEKRQRKQPATDALAESIGEAEKG